MYALNANVYIYASDRDVKRERLLHTIHGVNSLAMFSLTLLLHLCGLRVLCRLQCVVVE